MKFLLFDFIFPLFAAQLQFGFAVATQRPYRSFPLNLSWKLNEIFTGVGESYSGSNLVS